MIEYNNDKPDEPEFFQAVGNWYRRQWSLSMHQGVVFLENDVGIYHTDKNTTLISYWDSNNYKTERYCLPNSWEWA